MTPEQLHSAQHLQRELGATPRTIGRMLGIPEAEISAALGDDSVPAPLLPPPPKPAEAPWASGAGAHLAPSTTRLVPAAQAAEPAPGAPPAPSQERGPGAPPPRRRSRLGFISGRA